MAPPYDAVLLAAFGGPTSPEEVRPFLARVLTGITVPAERVEEVVRHYEAVGGRSPLNEITFRQAAAVAQALGAKALPLPVYVGLRNARPFFIEALQTMAADGVRRALGLILSSHQTEASWERYKKNIADARAEFGGDAPQVDFCRGWHDHPLFIATWQEQIRRCLSELPEARRQEVPLVFTAHSVPLSMAAGSCYVEQVHTSAALIARRLACSRWSMAYQSRSGPPSERWLEPEIGQRIRDIAAEGLRDVVVAPIGFVCDHVEVLYDIDIEAKKLAADCGVELQRAGCPNDHPKFIAMLADVIAKTTSGESPPLR